MWRVSSAVAFPPVGSLRRSGYEVSSVGPSVDARADGGVRFRPREGLMKAAPRSSSLSHFLYSLLYSVHHEQYCMYL